MKNKRREFLFGAAAIAMTPLGAAASDDNSDRGCFEFGDAPVKPVHVKLPADVAARFGLPAIIRVHVSRHQGMAVYAPPLVPVSLDRDPKSFRIGVIDVVQEPLLCSALVEGLKSRFPETEIVTADVDNRSVVCALVSTDNGTERSIGEAHLFRSNGRVKHIIEFTTASTVESALDLGCELLITGRHSQRDLTASVTTLVNATADKLHSVRDQETGSAINTILLPAERRNGKVVINRAAAKNLVQAFTRISVQSRRGADPSYIEAVVGQILAALLSPDALVAHLRPLDLASLAQAEDFVLAIDGSGTPWACRLAITNAKNSSGTQVSDAAKQSLDSSSGSSGGSFGLSIAGVASVGGSAQSADATTVGRSSRVFSSNSTASGESGHWPVLAVSTRDLISFVHQIRSSLSLDYGSFSEGVKAHAPFCPIERLPTQVSIERAASIFTTDQQAERERERRASDAIDSLGVLLKKQAEQQQALMTACDSLKGIEVEIQVIYSTDGYLHHLRAINSIGPELIEGHADCAKSRWQPFGPSIDAAKAGFMRKKAELQQERKTIEASLRSTRQAIAATYESIQSSRPVAK